MPLYIIWSYPCMLINMYTYAYIFLYILSLIHIYTGKDPKHYKDKEYIIQTVANIIPIISTTTIPIYAYNNVIYKGHQTSETWLQLLAESKFLLGLG